LNNISFGGVGQSFSIERSFCSQRKNSLPGRI
jgi:hypothetical protein